MKKIGLLDLDEGGLTTHSRTIFQTMWADNGDAISRQYAGTDAMKVRKCFSKEREDSTHRHGEYAHESQRDKDSDGIAMEMDTC